MGVICIWNPFAHRFVYFAPDLECLRLIFTVVRFQCVRVPTTPRILANSAILFVPTVRLHSCCRRELRYSCQALLALGDFGQREMSSSLLAILSV